MSHKEAYRYFWMVKGHFETSESTVLSCAEGYFKRDGEQDVTEPH